MLAGIPCGSSTRKKDQLVGDLSVQPTKGSRDNSPAGSYDGEVISPEQLRFTTAISKAMSKKIARLLVYWLVVIHDKPVPVSIGGPRRALSTAGYLSCVDTRNVPRPKLVPMTKHEASLVTSKVQLSITKLTRQSPNGTPLGR